MGCDIHWVVEIKTGDNNWLGICSSSMKQSKASERSYSFFAELGMDGRREKSAEAPNLRGFPEKLSDLTMWERERGCWDHSPSWLTLKEFCDSYNRAFKIYVAECDYNSLSCDYIFDYYFYDVDKSEYRVVFAFDN